MFIWYHKKSSINNDSTTVLLWFCGLSPISRQAHVARFDKLTPRTGRYRSPWPGFHQRTSSSPAVLHPKTSFAPVALRELHQLTFSWEEKGNQSKSYKYIYITYIINIIYNNIYIYIDSLSIPQIVDLPLGNRKSSLANQGFLVSCSEDWCSSKSSDIRRMRRDSFWMFGFLVSKSNDMLRTTLVVTDSSRCHWVDPQSAAARRSTGCFANFCRIPSVLVKLPWLCAPWSRSHGRSGRWIRFRKSSADLGARKWFYVTCLANKTPECLRILALFWLQTNQTIGPWQNSGILWDPLSCPEDLAVHRSMLPMARWHTCKGQGTRTHDLWSKLLDLTVAEVSWRFMRALIDCRVAQTLSAKQNRETKQMASPKQPADTCGQVT